MTGKNLLRLAEPFMPMKRLKTIQKNYFKARPVMETEVCPAPIDQN